MLLQYLIPEFDKMSNALDINSLTKKKQIPSGETLDQMRDSLNTGLQLEERYIEAFLRDVGTQAMSHVFQFYTTKQRLKLLGSDGVTFEDFDYDPHTLVPDETLPKYDHWKGFGLRVKAGSVHGGSRDREKSFAMQLYARGALPLRELYRVLELPNADQLIQQLKQEKEEGLSPAGKQPRSSGEKKGKQ
jgi:hypothetical protein